MLRALDKTYQRFANAWLVFRHPDSLNAEYKIGLAIGERIGYAKIQAVLKEHDVHQFSNQHFQLGYYYAAETVKKVMNDDEDYIVGEA